MQPRRIRRVSALGLSAVLLLAACTPSPSGTGPSGTATTGSASAGQEPEAAPSGNGASQRELDRLLSEGPDQATRERAAAAVAGMSLEQKAGQVLVAQLGAPGTDAAQLDELHLGGVIVMGDAVPTSGDGADPGTLRAQLSAVQEALSAGRDWSGIVSVDQEGGLVARIQAPLTEWPTPMSYGAADAGSAGDEEEAAELAGLGHEHLGRDLAELGFTVDFAPSVDVTIGAEDPVIGARAFSSDPAVVGELGAAAQDGLLRSGVLASPKHFPGHGSVTVDSHVTMPTQEQTVEELAERDWVPFAELLAASAAGQRYTPMVMMGHIEVPELDPGHPSSVSAAAYEALRSLGADGADTADTEGTGYDGVVVTDALNMGALTERYGADEAPVRALAAGADLLLMPSDVVGARESIVTAVQGGEVPEERLEQAATRVVTMLMWRDAVQGAVQDRADTDASALSRAVSAAAVTVVDGVCGEPMATDSLQIRGGNERDRARLTQAAEAAGLTVGSGPVVTLLGSARGGGEGDVVVALDAPFGLAESSAAEDGALVALYGRTPGAFEVLVEVLIGQAEAPGALPVEVGEWPAGTGC